MVISVLEKSLEKASKFIGRISHVNFASFSSSEMSGNENVEEPLKKSKKNTNISATLHSSTSSSSSSASIDVKEKQKEEENRNFEATDYLKREMSLSLFHLTKTLSAVSLSMDGAKNSHAIVYSSSIQTISKRKESTSTLSVFTAMQALGKLIITLRCSIVF